VLAQQLETLQGSSVAEVQELVAKLASTEEERAVVKDQV